MISRVMKVLSLKYHNVLYVTLSLYTVQAHYPQSNRLRIVETAILTPCANTIATDARYVSEGDLFEAERMTSLIMSRVQEVAETGPRDIRRGRAPRGRIVLPVAEVPMADVSISMERFAEILGLVMHRSWPFEGVPCFRI